MEKSIYARHSFAHNVGLFGAAVSILASPLFSSCASAQPDAPVAKTAPTPTAAKPSVGTTIDLGQTSNGCSRLLENANTDNERLVIIKDGKRNEFPSLKETKVRSKLFLQDIQKILEQSEAANSETWFNNRRLTALAKPEDKYKLRLELTAIMAETNYHMSREAILIEDSDTPSQYLQTYMIENAKKVLDNSLPNNDRVESTMSLMFHAFGKVEFEKQFILNAIKSRAKSDQELEHELRYLALSKGKEAYIEAQANSPKLEEDPISVSKKILENFSTKEDTQAALKFYRESDRLGFNKLGKVLEIALSGVQRIAFLNFKIQPN